MNCDWVADHLDEHELGGLDAVDRERVEAHLAVCEPCRQRLAAARAADAAIRSALAWAEPGAGFAERVARRARRPAAGRWVAAGVAAAAAALWIASFRWSGGPPGGEAERSEAEHAAPAERLLAGVLRDAYGLPARQIERGRPYLAAAHTAFALDPRAVVLLARGTEFGARLGSGQELPALTILSGAMVGDVPARRRQLTIELAPELGGAVVRTTGCQFYGTGLPADRLSGAGPLSLGGAEAWPEEIRIHVLEGEMELDLGVQRVGLMQGDSVVIAGGASAGSTRMVEARIRALRDSLGEELLARCSRYAWLCDAYARRLVELRAAPAEGALPFLGERRQLVEELLRAHAATLARMEAEHPDLLELDAAETELRRLDQLREEAADALEGLTLLTGGPG